MKSIPNTEVVGIPKSDQKPNCLVSDLIQFAINQAPNGGFDLATIRARNRVSDVLEKAGEVLDFEDADLETVKQVVRSCRWPWKHRAIERLADALGI